MQERQYPTGASLRQTLRNQRKAIPFNLRRHYDKLINKQLIRCGILQRTPYISSYISNDAEVSLDLFIQLCSARKVPHYLPVIKKKSQLEFSAYHSGDKLLDNKFKIPEPAITKKFNVKFLSVILMPLVGFDLQGNRLGMGGGFYDRTLAFSRNSHNKKRPLLIGVAYETQSVNTLSTRAWDVPLDAAITERNIYLFSTRARALLRTNTSVE